MVEALDEEEVADETLLACIAQGDRTAFTMLMRRHGERVRGLALSFTGQRGEADDITQEVFIGLWRRPLAWKPASAAFTTWLYRVVVNRCLDHARRRRFRRWLPFTVDIDPPDEAPNPAEAVAGRQQLAMVGRMIRSLPEKQRLALLLVIQDERSNAETARILGISEGAVEQLLVRARRKLRMLMENKETAS